MNDNESINLDELLKRFRRLLASAEGSRRAEQLSVKETGQENVVEVLSTSSAPEGDSLEDTTPITLKRSKIVEGSSGDSRENLASSLDTRGGTIQTQQPPVRSSTLPTLEIDTQATRVSRRATQASNDRVRASSSSTQQSRPLLNDTPRVNAPSINWGDGFGCLIRMTIFALFGFVALLLILGSFVLYEYYNIAATLPSVDDLRQRASTFETARIYDRNGDLLYEVLDPNAGRRTYIPLERISPLMVAATIATEDKAYYSHPGFDWFAILRAFWQNYQSGGETVSGASTITQQLARNLLFTPEERSQRTYMRKVREALLAAEITRRYSKDEILELYLNEFYYGNLAYGVEAAAETYFGTTVDKLDLAQASFLAGLPQAPSIYDIYTNPDATRRRHQDVLILMYEMSAEQDCIFVSNSIQQVCVSAQDAVNAYNELENYTFNSPGIQMRYPHWVNYIRSQLEARFDPQTIYQSGFSVYTTLDPDLQDAAEEIVSRQVENLAANNAHNAALVAIRPSTGEILAMVGSEDYYDEDIDGQVNMALSQTRQPGSSIKPITYLAAFEKGWTPGTLLWDVPSEFPPSGDPKDPRPPYVPVNYDGRIHGPVTLRSALANSYNIPAVKTLQFVGIYDNPSTPNEDGMISMAKRLGITSLTRPDYGLSLTLGGGEVSLFEMTSMYGVIANGGKRIPPASILKIIDRNGNVIFNYEVPAGDQVIRVEHAFLMTSILSDNTARTPAFGPDSVLNLPFGVAAKTGTTNDFRDNWTLGYTPDIVVGAWVGNADYTPMQNTSGLTGAAPIWAEFMQTAIQKLNGGNATPFLMPGGIIEKVICTTSGTEPSQWCPNQRSEYFAADQPPLSAEFDLWSKVLFDTWTGLRASQACAEFTSEEFALNVTDEWAKRWLKEDSQGQSWASDMGFGDPLLFVPSRECKAEDPRPYLDFTSLSDGQTIISSPIDIFARIDASADFDNYTLSYGIGSEPVEWILLNGNNQPVNPANNVYSWDVSNIQAVPVTLHLKMESTRDTYAEKFLHLILQVPTPTPTPTITPIPTFTPTQTPTVTLTPIPTSSSIPTNTPEPTTTEVNPPTATPTATP